MAKQRQVRIEQGLPQTLMDEMQDRSDEQLESESKHRSIALAILGARASERYDAVAARTYFQRAIAASRPQERMQIRRMADASLALAERRADDLKHAVEKLGHTPPSSRALMGLRLMRLIAPPPGASALLRIRGFVIVGLVLIGALALGLGVVELIALFFGGIGLAPGILLGVIVVGVALAVLAYFGRRRQRSAASAAKVSPPAKGAAAARSPAAAKAPRKPRRIAFGRGAADGGDTSARTGSGPEGTPGSPRGTKAPKAAAPARPTSPRAGATRRDGTAKGSTAAKPANGGPPAKRAKGPPPRPKRPSR